MVLKIKPRYRPLDALHPNAKSAHVPPQLAPPKLRQRPALRSVCAEDPWKPFVSSLFDTVRLVVPIKHHDLALIVAESEHMTRSGFMYYVKCPKTGASATVKSQKKSSALIMEFSLPKFLTGQNIVGIGDLHGQAVACIRKVVKLMRLPVNGAEMRDIEAGCYRITRVDIAVHADCRTAERAHALMIALRRLFVSRGKDVSAYGDETLYIGQHSKRRSFKAYNKGKELARHPIPQHVYGAKHLTERAQSLVRFELVLRREQLSDLNLDDPLGWTEAAAHREFDIWIARLRLVEGVVAEAARIEMLARSLQQKTRAWLLGDGLAFMRNVSRATYLASRRQVFKVTGIDIGSTLTPQQQRASLLSIRSMFERGFGFHYHGAQWPRLLARVQ